MVVRFKGSHRATEVLEGYFELHPGETWARLAGVISRHKLGRITIDQSLGDEWDDEDVGTAAGLGIGGMTGALLGLVGGPAGVAAGAIVGGALGGIAGASEVNEQPTYTIIRGKLAKNSSAIVLLADEDKVDRMLKELGPEGVDTMRRPVSDEARWSLEAAIREAAREEPATTPAH